MREYPRGSAGRVERLRGAGGWLTLGLLALAAVLVTGAGPAYRWELLPLRGAFGALRYGVYAALGAGGAGLVLVIVDLGRRQFRRALPGAMAVILGVLLAGLPLLQWQRAQRVPPIHDITTDLEAPPAFVALAAARQAAPNGLAYPGGESARQQRAAYPDIAPLRLQAPRARVLEAARAEALAAGWTLAAVGDDGLEATATTPWFGFKDDIVLRLRESDGGVRVDMRSASRIGRSDVGANAARIRAYLAALARRLAGR